MILQVAHRCVASYLGRTRTLTAGEMEVDDAEGAAYVRQLPHIVSEVKGPDKGTVRDDAQSEADPMPAPDHRMTKPGRYRRKRV